MPQPQLDEHPLDSLRRLVREDREHQPAIMEQSQRAIDETRRLLEKIAKDHPDIE